jgi:hypothetical protein
MPAYYNEIDPFAAAAWLRELISKRTATMANLPEYLTPEMIERVFGLDIHTLARFRSKGGPPFIKPTRNTVLYPRQRFETWLAGIKTQANTKRETKKYKDKTGELERIHGLRLWALKLKNANGSTTYKYWVAPQEVSQDGYTLVHGDGGFLVRSGVFVTEEVLADNKWVRWRGGRIADAVLLTPGTKF